MPFKIYPEKRLIISCLSGPIVHQDVLNWIDELLCNESFSEKYDQIVDLRKAVFKDPNPETARHLSSYMAEHNFTQGKMAILTDTPTETALVMIYSQKEIQKKRPAEVFSTIEAAARFVGKDPGSIKMLMGD